MFDIKTTLSTSFFVLLSLMLLGMISNSNVMAATSVKHRPPPPRHSTSRRTNMAPSSGIPSFYKAEFRGNVKTQGSLSIQGAGSWICYAKKCESKNITFGVPACQKLSSSQGFVVSFIYYNGGTGQTQRLNRNQLNQCNGRNQHAAPVVVHAGRPAADKVRTTSLVLLGKMSGNKSAPDKLKTSSLILLGQNGNSPSAQDKIKTTPLILLGKSSGAKAAADRKKTTPLILLGKRH